MKKSFILLTLSFLTLLTPLTSLQSMESEFSHSAKRKRSANFDNIRPPKKTKQPNSQVNGNRNCGLINNLTICYLNSAVQCLCNLPEFRRNLLANEQAYKSNTLVYNFIQLIKNLRESDTPIKNDNFANKARNLIRQQSRANAQQTFQDANEFLSLFFNKPKQEELKSFNMQLDQEIECSSCKNKSNPPSPLEAAIFPVELSAPNLHQILANNYSSTPAHNYKCDGCNKENTSSITRKISQYPHELIITLKRFAWDQGKMIPKPDPVQFPTTLDLKPYATTELQQMPANSLYELVGMVCYDGAHYISYAKDFESGKWYLYDDANVQPIDAGKIQKITAAGIADYNFVPYILFYTLKTNVQHNPEPNIEQEQDEPMEDTQAEQNDDYSEFSPYKENLLKFQARLTQLLKKLEELINEKGNDDLVKIITRGYYPKLKKDINCLDILSKQPDNQSSIDLLKRSIQKNIDDKQLTEILSLLKEDSEDKTLLDRIIYLHNKNQNLLKRNFDEDEFSEISDSELKERQQKVKTSEEKQQKLSRAIIDRRQNKIKARSGEKNLVGIDLFGQDLSGLTLENANLTGADLRNTNLSNAKLNGANLTNTELNGANLTNADLTKANLTNTVFAGAILENTKLRETNLTKADFTGVAKWHNVDLYGIKEASGAKLSGLDLSGVIFTRNANLDDTDLSECNLSGAVLTSGTTFRRTNLKGAILNGTNLNDTIFENTDLSGATLTDTKVNNITIENSVFINAKFEKIDFNKSKLKNVNFDKIIANKLHFISTELNNLSFKEAKLNFLCIYDNECLGEKLDFSDATLENCCFRGKTISHWDIENNEEKVRCSQLEKTQESFLSSFAPVGIASSVLGVACTPIALITIPVAYVSKKCIAPTILDRFNFRNKSNINCFIKNFNFCNTSLENVIFINLAFIGNVNFKTIKKALGCIFQNIYFKDLKCDEEIEILNLLKKKGAKAHSSKLRNDVDPDFKDSWKGEPSIEDKITAIFSGEILKKIFG